MQPETGTVHGCYACPQDMESSIWVVPATGALLLAAAPCLAIDNGAGCELQGPHCRPQKRTARPFRIPPGLALSQAISVLQSNPLVEFAEPNWIYTKQQSANPDDPMLRDLWGMLGASTSPSNGYGSGALAAWNAGHRCTSGVHVGTIDEELMISNADLRQNVWANSAEVPANGRDDDGNGLADDMNGWDFVSNDNTVYDGRQDDHGTHVGGTAAASTNNTTGVFGVCGHARSISAKFLGQNGGTTSNAIKAVDYLTDLETRKAIRLVATNNSWGGGGYSQALADAIGRAGAAGILFIAAAGNDGKNLDTSPSHPASYALSNMIVVAATDRYGSMASFSNYSQSTVHIAAPGVDILLTVPTKTGCVA